MKKKILSFLLAILMLVPFAALPAQSLFVQAQAEVASDGYIMPPVAIIIELYHRYCKLMQLLTGDENFSEEHYNLIIDETFASVMGALIEESGIDFSQVWTRLPETKEAAARLTTAFRMNIPQVQADIIAKETELENNGQPLLGGILRIVALFLGIVEECKLCCEPVEGSETQMNIVLYVTYRDGRQDVVHSPIFYNKDTLTFTNRDGGPVFIGFYFNAREGAAWTGRDVWQRNMGYGFLYDLICYLNPFFIDFNTQRVKFFYDNKQWMIQLWKGRYFIANGAEIGIYTRPAYILLGTWYKCADDTETMPMSLSLSHAGEDFFSIPLDDAWWLSKFKVSRTAFDAKAMTLRSTITMKDEKMLDAFTASLKLHPQINYTVDGLNVNLVW